MGKKLRNAKRRESKKISEDRLPRKLRERLSKSPQDISATLEAAEFCARNFLESRLSELLAPFESEIIADRAGGSERGRSLLALGYIAAGRLAEAEAMAEQALRESGPSPDALYLIARVKRALRSFSECIQAANEYEELFDRNSPGPPQECLFNSDHHRARVLIWLGEVLSETGEVDQAVAAFRRSISLDETNPRPYLELIRLCTHLRNREEALEVLRNGLDKCSDKQELLMIREYLRERPSISACMIVRNEERLLPECLDSIRDWVDEIILVDTGSSDATMDIARQYGARVFQQPWENDFSKHRNYSLEQATGDWLFIIDADERFSLEDVPHIIDHMCERRFSALAVNVLNVYGQDQKRVTFCNSARFFRRDLNLRYGGIVHNVLQFPEGLPVLQTRARLKHLGYDLPPEQMKAKFKRTLSLLKQQLSDEPDDVFALFNYAELLRGVEPNISSENAAEVIRAATRVTELVDASDKSRRHLRLMALNQLAAVHIAQKEWDRALAYCQAALELKPDYLDGLVHLGLACYGKKDYLGALAQFQAYLKAQAEFDGASETWPVIISYPDARDLAYNNLGALYELTGEASKAEQSYRKALEVNPHYRETASRLARLYQNRGDFENAEKWYRNQLGHRPTSDTMINLASLCYQSGRYDEAESLYRQVIGQFGATSALENDLGNCLFKSGRFEESEICYLRSVALLPLEPLAWRNLAAAQGRMGKCEDALASIEKYLELCPQDPPALVLAGDLLRLGGNNAVAIACYEQALGLNPAETAALTGLSEGYLAMGHRDAAILGYRKLVETDPHNRSARERLDQISATATKA